MKHCIPNRSINISRNAFSKLSANTQKVKAVKKKGCLPYDIPSICVQYTHWYACKIQKCYYTDTLLTSVSLQPQEKRSEHMKDTA